MSNFSVDDEVVTTRVVRSGYSEDGPFICNEGVQGKVLEVDTSEWDGVSVELESGATWWFKPAQLVLKN